MSVVVTKTPVEIVVREHEQVDYVCDACGRTHTIGQPDPDNIAVNTLHPPRS